MLKVIKKRLGYFCGYGVYALLYVFCAPKTFESQKFINRLQLFSVSLTDSPANQLTKSNEAHLFIFTTAI